MLGNENSQETQTNSLISLVLELDKMLFSMAYAEGFKKLGKGAIISNTKGNSYGFVSITQLTRLERYPQLGAFASLNRSLVDLVEQCPRDRFMLIYEIYQPFFPFGKKLLVIQEELALPLGLATWGF